MTDNNIIDLLENRSENAISELAKKYGNLCYSISKNILNNQEDAEECINDSYLGVWNNIPPKRPTSLKAYLCCLVRNQSTMRYNSNTAQKRNIHLEAVLDEFEGTLKSIETPESLLIARELTQYINEFLEGLETDNQIIFTRRYWYLDTTEDISKRLNIKPNTVNVKLKRIRKRFEKFLIKKEWNSNAQR